MKKWDTKTIILTTVFYIYKETLINKIDIELKF